jgi:hypothetical protein
MATFPKVRFSDILLGTLGTLGLSSASSRIPTFDFSGTTAAFVTVAANTTSGQAESSARFGNAAVPLPVDCFCEDFSEALLDDGFGSEDPF